MKKTGLIVLLAITMTLCLTMTTMGEPGLQVGLGYDSLDSTSTISYKSLDILKISNPCKMYTLSLDYEVNNWLSFSGKYSTGDSNLMGILELLDITQDTEIWQVEAKLQWGIGEKAKIGAVLGYLDYETETSLSILADLTSNISGAYLGPVITITPNDSWELGASYRYMINADSDISLASAFIKGGTVPADDASYAVAEIYAKTQLSENWTLRAGYSYTTLDWSVGDIKVSRDLDGLSIMLGYKF